MASDKSGRRTTGRRRSSNINDHTVLNLSPFAVIFDNTERTQRQPRCGEGVYQTGTCADRSWAALVAIARDVNGFHVVLQPRSLSFCLSSIFLVGLMTWSRD